MIYFEGGWPTECCGPAAWRGLWEPRTGDLAIEVMEYLCGGSGHLLLRGWFSGVTSIAYDNRLSSALIVAFGDGDPEELRMPCEDDFDLHGNPYTVRANALGWSREFDGAWGFGPDDAELHWTCASFHGEAIYPLRGRLTTKEVVEVGRNHLGERP